MNVVNEGDTFTVTASFYDSENAAALPSSIRYQVYCKTTRKVIRDWTDVAIGTEVTITLTSSDNAIQQTRNPFERRQLVVQSNPGTSQQLSKTLEWNVTNLGGVTVN